MTLSLKQPPPSEVISRMIALWGLDFNVVTYPQLGGWVLCNGANGTPDMRNRMVRGTPALGAVGAVGGTADHCHGLSLTTDPDGAHAHPGSTTDQHAHSHAGSSLDSYQHNHVGSSVACCAWVHSHVVAECQFPLSCTIYCSGDSAIDMADPTHTHLISNTPPAPDGDHTHGLTITQDNHTHIMTIAQDIHDHLVDVPMTGDHDHGVVGNVDTRTDLWPPYTNLHFIMKL